jgi:hypothetical protein
MSEQTQSPRRAALIVFQRELRGRLVNISRSGCLIEVARAVRVGTVCRLRVALDNVEYADDVRVARCTSGNGATCELGLELLRVPKPRQPRSEAPSVALLLHVSGDGPAATGLWLTGT